MAQRISTEEYNRQSSEYTKAALAELNKQMANKVIPINRKRDIIVSDDDVDEVEIHEPVNISVSLGNTIPFKKKTVVKQNITDNSYLIEINEKLEDRLEYCQAKINKLTAAIDNLESEIDELDKKYHYLKLDYSNKCLEFENLEKKYKIKCEEYIAIKNTFIKFIVIIIIIIMMVIIL
jgi:hypothetical protein